jgi:hypothetical protein
MTFMNVNSKNIVQRTLGLLLLLLLAVDGVALKIVPTEAGAVYAVVSLTLLAVACVSSRATSCAPSGRS